MKNFGIKEIAALAGVSIGTVDRVLNKRKGVAPSTSAKILEIVKEHGYKKNIIASRLKLASNKKIKLAILFPKYKNKVNYWSLPKRGVLNAILELKEKGITASFYYFESQNPDSFRQKSSIILTKKYDAIIAAPFIENECSDLLINARNIGVPVVFLDTYLDLTEKSYNICQNSYKAGLVAGRLLEGLLGSNGPFFIFNNLNEGGKQINSKNREEGFRQFFIDNKSHPEIHTINLTHFDKYTFSKETQRLLNCDKTVGIFVTNSRSHLLVNSLLKNNINDYKIIGFDLNDQNIKLMREGKINFLINQKPEFQGYSSVKGLFTYLTEKEESQLNIDIPVEIKVKENLPS